MYRPIGTGSVGHAPWNDKRFVDALPVQGVDELLPHRRARTMAREWVASRDRSAARPCRSRADGLLDRSYEAFDGHSAL